MGYTTEYGYDEVGNVISVKNARGKSRTFWYDDADRLVRADYPDSTYETWTLRDDGRVYQHRDGRGRVTTYRYDADDRLAGSGIYKAIDYPNDDDVRIVRDDDGLVTSFTEGTGTTNVVYYPSGWVKSVTNGASRTVTYEYNGVGAVSTLKTPGNQSFSYTYNANNQIASVTNPENYTISYQYDNGGRRTRVTRDGSYIQYGYNARNWITTVLNRKTDGTTLYDLYYYYSLVGSNEDHTGNPLRRHEFFPGSAWYRTNYLYDGVYRLLGEARWVYDPTVSLDQDVDYTYDAVGNRLSLTLNGTTTSYSYDDNDKLTSASSGGLSATLGYDNAGNMTSVSGSLFPNWTLVYDDESRLTSITYPWGEGTSTDEYVYNALGQAMEYQPDGYARQAMVYDGDRLLEYRYASSDGIKGRYTNESGSYYSPWQSVNTSTNARFPLYDAVGSAPRLVDETGTLKYYQTLDAFGVPRTAGYGGDSPVNYQRFGGAWGYLTSYNMGLMKLGARFYWPEVGRFASQDPIGDGVNWYAYVGGNPVVRIDPSGRIYLDLGASGGFFGKGGVAGVKIGRDPCVKGPWKPWDPRTWRYVHPYAGFGTALGGKFSAALMPGNPSGGLSAGTSGVVGIPLLAGFGPAAQLGGGPGGPEVGVGVGWGFGYFGGITGTL